MVLVNKMAGNVLQSLFLIEGDRYLWHLSLSFYLEASMSAGSGEAMLRTEGHQQEGRGERIAGYSYWPVSGVEPWIPPVLALRHLHSLTSSSHPLPP